ncbi:hypothetical protein FOA43_002568 [Brettanomyces nanus]|uniref:Major facilitator superfamily (MFS) profile domain-containing protein n=1 Tax=Eeniella nana TaxID=13502 RepID=A0A875S2N8_EENNA|nr:uncharacterized protein FOA43_002568 [Brettanomyces nanus]QPG75218.1 hypothetical protein FOA43_002568 [Brettanomyces nanus]
MASNFFSSSFLPTLNSRGKDTNALTIKDKQSILQEPLETTTLKQTSKNEDENETDSIHLSLHQKGTSALAWLMCSLVGFSGFSYGWDTGTISGIINMPDYLERFGEWNYSTNAYELSEVRMGLIISFVAIGAAIGGITLGKVADIYGRKPGLIISMIVYIVGCIIEITSTDKWYQFFIGRIIVGISFGCNCVLGPMFISEISPRDLRGTLVSLFQLLNTAGIFVGYCVVYHCNHHFTGTKQWRVPVGVSFVWAFLTILGVNFAPESPRFLFKKGKVDEGRKSISRINKVPDDSVLVTVEADSLTKSIEREKLEGNSSWRELIYGRPKLFYRVSLGLIVESLQQLTGINYFFYYGTTIFTSVGLQDSYVTSIILGMVNFVSTFAALYFIDHFGRRNPLLLGDLCMMICLVIFSSLGYKALYPDEFGVDANKSAGNAMIFFTCLFLFFYATTWGPIPPVILSESYPLRIRAKAMGIAMSANWFWCFLIAFFTPFISGAIHFAYGFVFFGCTFVAFFYVFTCVPETKGMPLEDIDDMYARLTPGFAFRQTQQDKEAKGF